MIDAVRPLALFISYSHKDDAWRRRLDTHLALLKRQRVFDVWHDRRIGAGRDWAGDIDEALERSSVVLLLVSSDFLASDYCYDKEMQRALERHRQHRARVVPVILRKCDWESSDFGWIQAIPRDGRPIASYPDADEAMTEVALSLRRVAEEMRSELTPVPSPSPPPDAVCPPTVAPAQAETPQTLDEGVALDARGRAKQPPPDVDDEDLDDQDPDVPDAPKVDDFPSPSSPSSVADVPLTASAGAAQSRPQRRRFLKLKLACVALVCLSAYCVYDVLSKCSLEWNGDYLAVVHGSRPFGDWTPNFLARPLASTSITYRDVSSPLTDLTASAAVGPQGYRAWIRTVVELSKPEVAFRIQSLVDGTADLSRIEAGRPGLDPIQVDLMSWAMPLGPSDELLSRLDLALPGRDRRGLSSTANDARLTDSATLSLSPSQIYAYQTAIKRLAGVKPEVAFQWFLGLVRTEEDWIAINHADNVTDCYRIIVGTARLLESIRRSTILATGKDIGSAQASPLVTLAQMHPLGVASFAIAAGDPDGLLSITRDRTIEQLRSTRTDGSPASFESVMFASVLSMNSKSEVVSNTIAAMVPDWDDLLVNAWVFEVMDASRFSGYLPGGTKSKLLKIIQSDVVDLDTRMHALRLLADFADKLSPVEIAAVVRVASQQSEHHEYSSVQFAWTPLAAKGYLPDDLKQKLKKELACASSDTGCMNLSLLLSRDDFDVAKPSSLNLLHKVIYKLRPEANLDTDDLASNNALRMLFTAVFGTHLSIDAATVPKMISALRGADAPIRDWYALMYAAQLASEPIAIQERVLTLVAAAARSESAPEMRISYNTLIYKVRYSRTLGRQEY